MFGVTSSRSGFAATFLVLCGVTVPTVNALQIPQEQPLIQFRFARETPAPGHVRMEAAGPNGTIYVETRNVIADEDIQSAVVHESSEQFVATIELTPEGSSRLEHATKGKIGSRFAMLVNSHVVAEGVIRSPLVSPLRIAVPLADLPTGFAEAVAEMISARWPQ